VFLSALKSRISNDPQQPHLTADLFRSVTTERARGNNARIVSYGSIVEFRFVGEETVDNKKVYRYIAVAPKRTMLWRFSQGPDGKISEMSLEEDE
jgi:hypothetical protein